MANNGTRFRDALVREIESWNEGITVLTERYVGYRFLNNVRQIDIVLKFGNKHMGIEAKLQQTPGTAYQKLSYTLDDVKNCPIPTIIVFSGPGIKDDMKSKLIVSGFGLEVKYIEDTTNSVNDTIEDYRSLFRQRIYIELGLDWFKLQP